MEKMEKSVAFGTQWRYQVTKITYLINYEQA